jgi:outer membrane beta-barrel protein
MVNHIQKISWAACSLILALSFSSFAVDIKKDEVKKVENADSDKLDIQKLEQKYWSAKDDDFTVIQNRAFTKAGRFYINPSYGTPFNDPNSVGSMYGVNAGYYFSEKFGLELGYTTSNLKINDTVSNYKQSYGAIPDYNTFKSAATLMAYWVPIYAKMSLLDKKIIYFDMGIGAGVGTTGYDQNLCLVSNNCGSGGSLSANNTTTISKSAIHYAINVTQQYFLSEHWAVRVDFMNRWSAEESLSSKTGSSLGNKSVNDTALQFGFTYWFSLKKEE